MPESKRRVRRGRDEARRAILEAAEKRLGEGGPEAVRVQHIAADLGITDAAIHHHFGSRQGLLEALLRFAGRRLREEVDGILQLLPESKQQSKQGSDGHPEALERVAELIADAYAVKGHARLALSLALSGWEPSGGGLFEPLVDSIHRARLQAARAAGRPRPRRQQTQYDVALLNIALAAAPLFGPGFLRSVGLDADAEAQQRYRSWLVRRLADMLAE